MKYMDVMYEEIKSVFVGKLRSLMNDYKRSSHPMKNKKIQTAPFPITMYAISVLDLFSSYEAGWNEPNKKLSRNQTTRMVNYLVEYMGYDKIPTRALVQMHRHQLMHTSEPRMIQNKKTRDVFAWEISDSRPNHMTLRKTTFNNPKINDIQELRFNIKDFIKDLESASKKYLSKVKNNQELIERYTACKEEIKKKIVDFDA